MKKKPEPKNVQAERMLLVMAAIVFIIAIVSCNPIQWVNEKLGLKADNQFEQAVEAVIEHETGISLDLTPDAD